MQKKSSVKTQLTPDFQKNILRKQKIKNNQQRNNNIPLLKIKKMNTKNLIPRILAFPFMIFLMMIPTTILYLKWMKKFILYGGEVIAYKDKDERKTVTDLYYLIKNQNKKES